MLWLVLVGLIVAALVAVGLSGSGSGGAPRRSRAEDVARFGLTELDERLRREIIESSPRAALGTDPRLLVVNVMLDMLREFETTPIPEGQAAIIEPKSELERMACEELVKLGYLMVNPDKSAFAFQGMPRR